MHAANILKTICVNQAHKVFHLKYASSQKITCSYMENGRLRYCTCIQESKTSTNHINNDKSKTM